MCPCVDLFWMISAIVRARVFCCCWSRGESAHMLRPVMFGCLCTFLESAQLEHSVIIRETRFVSGRTRTHTLTYTCSSYTVSDMTERRRRITSNMCSMCCVSTRLTIHHTGNNMPKSTLSDRKYDKPHRILGWRTRLCKIQS